MVRILYILLLLPQLLLANMASPFVDGTRAGSAFSSRDVDVLSEHIGINLDPTGTDAQFTIEYNIYTSHSGLQIPLLFIALNYEYGFRVWLDGKEILVTEIPSKFIHFNNSPFEGFKNAQSTETIDIDPDQVIITWDDLRSETHTINELKYFEADLCKGVHNIRVEYSAYDDLYLGNWVVEHTLRYSLSPAKHWRSFGTITVTIEQHGHPVILKTNLGTPKHFGNKQQWSFNKLPADYLEISYTPKINFFAEILISIGPMAPTLLASAMMTSLHVIWIKRFRRRNPFKKFSRAVIVGSIVAPFLFVVAFMLSFPLIDAVIGPNASEFHGYTFLAVLVYPIVMPLYWICMWIVDRRFKKRLNRNA